MPEIVQDPFQLHLELLKKSPDASGEGLASGEEPIVLKGRFESGEHQFLGMLGAAAVCKGRPNGEADLEMLRRLRRPGDGAVLTYGEIVALSGDFYGTPEDLLSQKAARFPWWKGTNDLATLRGAFESELEWIRDERRPANAGYPDHTFTFIWTAKSYLELAEDNTAHFGWHNIVRYCEYHKRAIELAISSRDPSVDDEDWVRALYYNGFADHFLTDGFAAGHIRVPRAQIRAWAPKVGYSGKLAGLLSKVLHDQDGHVDGLHGQGEQPLDPREGLAVQNALGVQWSTRCDGQLFLVAREGTDDPLLAQPVAAVTASLGELFTAQETKQRPAGEYAALKHVPFPAPGSATLAAKFGDTSPERISRLLDSCRWYTELPFVEDSLAADNMTKLFQALPGLMQRFREDVADEYSANADLKLRLPAAYVDAFKSIA